MTPECQSPVTKRRALWNAMPNKTNNRAVTTAVDRAALN